ncbi:MAG: lasso peptide biosynthesis B2 protein [Trebonia sp.]
MLNLQVAEHVRCRTQEHGGVVILDPAGGEWLALNATAGDLWRAWESGAEFERGVREVAARYPDVPAAAIRDDAWLLARELIVRGLVEPGDHGTARTPRARGHEPGTGRMTSLGNGAVMAAPWEGARRPRVLPAAQALACLAVAILAIRFLPFRASLAMVRCARRSWCRPVAPTDGTALVTAVGWAVRRYPGRAACLEQSLAAVLLGAVRRRRLDWCLGVAADPYRFHAWVEAAGQPVIIPGDPQPTAEFARMLIA